MIELLRYTSDYKSQWDHLISCSRNGTFLFYRDYLEYHSDRFNDHSFIFFKKGRIEAVIPGNVTNATFISHEGLTYGGLISSANIVTTDVLEIFKLFNSELEKIGIKEVIYKLIPSIYHFLPCQEDIFVLALNRAIKMECNISTTIFMNNKLPFRELRKRGAKKSLRNGVNVIESDNYSGFWEILENNLIIKYNVKPTHSIEEIKYLKNRFPDNIKLYLAQKSDQILAGVLLFITRNVIHCQYISANEEGKRLCSLDLIFDELINKQIASTYIFDFGISTENMGNFLNTDLIFHKEGFGGRAIVYEIYKYEIEQTLVPL